MRKPAANVSRADGDRASQALITEDQIVIHDDKEVEVSRERVAKLEHTLETLRNTARAEEWPALSSGYRLEIERMQGEILDYLVQNAPRGESAPA